MTGGETRWSEGMVCAGHGGKTALRCDYQRSLRANWSWRAVVEVLVMAPAVGLGAAEPGVKTTRLGVLKFARFSKLKNSARN